jgi:two-component system, OmpR family, sensor histidine kinase BaeS
MRKRFRFLIPPPPPWWPENEPWPPMHKNRARGWRDSFFIRFGCLFPLFFFLFIGVLCALGGAAIGSYLHVPEALSTWSWIALPIVLLFSIWLLVMILLRRLIRPLGKVMDASDRVASGDYSTRLPERSLHDFRDLAHSFNAMSSRLESFDQQRKRLLADISHELRTPLTVLQGNVEGMLDNVYPRDDEHLGLILEETHILSRLIDDLRTLSLAETGRLSIHKEPINPYTLINDVVEAMQSASAQHGVQLTGESDRGVPPIELDPARIRQVLENLIANAIRHTSSGGNIHVGCGARVDLPNRLEFWVMDDGRGISPENLPNIFDRYYKSNDSGGTGLGLAIAKQLVEAHGGSIHAESQLERGTTIKFELPIQ